MSGTLPPTWWVLGGAVLLALGRYAQLHLRHRARAAERDAALDHGIRLRQSLVEIGAGAGPSAMPGDLADASGWLYRPVPRFDVDRRLVVLHEAAPVQTITRFPNEEAARVVVFADGRADLFSEAAFQQLLVGDDVLRERLALPAVADLPAEPVEA